MPTAPIAAAPPQAGEEMESPPCTICRVQDTEGFPAGSYHLNVLPPIGVARCRRCRMLFLSPRPAQAMRRALMDGEVPAPLAVYSSAPANYGEVTTGRTEVFQARLRELDALCPLADGGRPRRLLDVGASAGTLVELAREAGWESSGVEPSIDGVRRARERGIELAHGVAEELPFPGESFDVVHAHHVFEHLADPLTAAREAFRVLAPGGRVFIEVPNQFDNIGFRRDMLFGRVTQRQRNMRSIHHLWFFSRRTLRALLEEAGYVDVRVQDVYLRPATGWRAAFSYLSRAAGRVAFGGPILRATGRKP